MMKYCHWFILFVLLTVSGCHGNGNGSAVHVATDFESGSIGEVLILSDGELELSLANDNHNPDLPKRWRNWCRENDIGEIYLAYTQSFEAVNPEKYDFDGAIESANRALYETLEAS